MKNTLVKLEILFPQNVNSGGSVKFVRGSAKFNSSSRNTSHGVVYDCDFRFAVYDSDILSPLVFCRPSILRLMFYDAVVVIGTAEIPALCVLDSRDPDVYIVKYTSLNPFY